jgi:hypothetical protein
VAGRGSESTTVFVARLICQTIDVRRDEQHRVVGADRDGKRITVHRNDGRLDWRSGINDPDIVAP